MKKKIAKNAISTAPVIVNFFRILSLDLDLFFLEYESLSCPPITPILSFCGFCIMITTIVAIPVNNISIINSGLSQRYTSYANIESPNKYNKLILDLRSRPARTF